MAGTLFVLAAMMPQTLHLLSELLLTYRDLWKILWAGSPKPACVHSSGDGELGRFSEYR